MPRRFLLYVLLLPTLAAGQSKTFTIQGKLTGAESVKIYLYIADIITGTSRSDSAILKNGNFSFKGALETPLKAILFSTPDNNRLDFYIEAGTIKIFSRDSLDNASVSAGKLNADFIKLRARTDRIEKDMRSYNRMMQAAVEASPEKERDFEFQRNWDLKRKATRAELMEVNRNFVENNPDNFASIYALASMGGTSPDLALIQPLFEGLDQAVQHSALGTAYGKKLRKLASVSVGATAPEFTQSDTAGRAVSLRDFRGKYVLIDFWASWCGPCREENPNLIKAFEQYKNSNFTVLGLSLDRGTARGAWLKAIAKDGLPWTQVSDLKGWDNEVARLYGVESVPNNFLIDPTGKIVAKDLRGAGLHRKLSELLDVTR